MLLLPRRQLPRRPGLPEPRRRRRVQGGRDERAGNGERVRSRRQRVRRGRQLLQRKRGGRVRLRIGGEIQVSLFLVIFGYFYFRMGN